jgi:hypothetical protein
MKKPKAKKAVKVEKVYVRTHELLTVALEAIEEMAGRFEDYGSYVNQKAMDGCIHRLQEVQADLELMS